MNQKKDNTENFVNNHLPKNTHLRKRHLDLDDHGHTRRITDKKQTRNSSCFYSEEILQSEIENCIKDKNNQELLSDWLSSDEQRLDLIYENGTHTIGQGITMNPKTKRLTEYRTRTTLVSLKKDPNMPDGFAIVTAFPVLTKTKTPTGRDISHPIRKTELYEKASPIKKIALEIANSPRFDPNTMNIQSTNDQIQLQENNCQSTIQATNITYTPNRDTAKQDAPSLYSFTEQTRKRLGIPEPVQPVKQPDVPKPTVQPAPEPPIPPKQVQSPESKPNPVPPSPKPPEPKRPKLDKGKLAEAYLNTAPMNVDTEPKFSK